MEGKRNRKGGLERILEGGEEREEEYYWRVEKKKRMDWKRLKGRWKIGR